MRLKGDVLEYIRLDDQLIWIFLNQGHQGAGAANDSFTRGDGARGETRFSQRFEHFFFRGIVAHGTILRSYFTNLRARTRISHVRFITWRPEEFDARGGEAAVGNRFAISC